MTNNENHEDRKMKIVWLANNALVAYVGVQLKQSFFFKNVCIVPYIKKAQLIRLLCDFFDCFNAKLHSSRSSY